MLNAVRFDVPFGAYFVAPEHVTYLVSLGEGGTRIHFVSGEHLDVGDDFEGAHARLKRTR
jgi:hypothetical protein